MGLPRVGGALQDDVGGFQIAVDDALLVRRVERLGDLARNRESLGNRQRAALEAIGERGPSTSSRTSAVTPSASSNP